jgi:hypothetical protein
MSLHTLANHLQSAGRGDDKVLVHMTKDEVGGLQSLAKAHGGSLTINPETGLAEAGFLSSLLPTLIGAGLSIASGGALTPLMAAGLTGAGYGIAKGSLKEGLMAGLGAYGGAGLAAGLTATGAGALTPALSSVPQATIPAGTAATTSLIPNAATPLSQAINTAGTANLSAAVPAMSVAPGASSVTSSLNLPQLTAANVMTQPTTWDKVLAGAKEGFGSTEGLKTLYGNMPQGSMFGLGAGVLGAMQQKPGEAPPVDKGMIRPYSYSVEQNQQAYAPSSSTAERNYFTEPRYTALTPYAAAEGGIMGAGYAVGGQVEEMSAQNAISANQTYPQSQLKTDIYSNPMMQRPVNNNVITGGMDAPVNAYTGEARFAKGGNIAKYQTYATAKDGSSSKKEAISTASKNLLTEQGLRDTLAAAKAGDYASYVALQNAGYDVHSPEMYSGSGVSGLGGYSDGGRLLKGPGDGVSDSIPAVIGNKQPARLADGEFVVPARIVSELGNGSTEAGAKRLYAMMDRVQKARGKTTGKGKVAVNSRADKHLPA